MAKKGEILKPLAERFWSFVDKNGANGCWEWTGSKVCGYGQLARGWKKAPYRANRLSYELNIGPIADGMVVRHKCDNPGCVNPEHLELGTQKDNARDTSSRNRLNPKSLLNLRPGAPGHHGATPPENSNE